MQGGVTQMGRGIGREWKKWSIGARINLVNEQVVVMIKKIRQGVTNSGDQINKQQST